MKMSGKRISEGVPHEVFGPWVWWGRGQVISVLSSSSSSQRRRRPLPPQKKIDIGALGQKLSKMTKQLPFGRVSVFQKSSFYSTATQEEQGSKRGPFLHIYKKIYFIDVDRWIRVEKLVWLIKFSLRVDGTEALSWKDLGFEPRDLGFEKWSKNGPKNCRKIFFPKMSKIHFPGLGTLR